LVNKIIFPQIVFIKWGGAKGGLGVRGVSKSKSRKKEKKEKKA